MSVIESVPRMNENAAGCISQMRANLDPAEEYEAEEAAYFLSCAMKMKKIR